MKAKLLSVLLILLAVTPTASALIHDEQWVMDAAITAVENEYGLNGVTWTSTITSIWHVHTPLPIPQHKHVTLEGSYGYKNTGQVTWTGRVFRDGTIYTLSYSNTKPVRVVFTTTVKNPQWASYWNGSYWVYNTPDISVIGGRTWVIYPRPPTQ